MGKSGHSAGLKNPGEPPNEHARATQNDVGRRFLALGVRVLYTSDTTRNR